MTSSATHLSGGRVRPRASGQEGPDQRVARAALGELLLPMRGPSDVSMYLGHVHDCLSPLKRFGSGRPTDERTELETVVSAYLFVQSEGARWQQS
jgi:hypothetical protein